MSWFVSVKIVYKNIKYKQKFVLNFLNKILMCVKIIESQG